MNNSLVVDPFVIAMIVGVFIPIATGIVTKLNTSSGLKATVAAVLSVIVGVATQIGVAGTFEWKAAVLTVGTAFAANVTSYLGVHSVIGSGTPVGSQATANFGIGAPVTDGT